MAKGEEIQETVLSMADLDGLEVGGARRLDIASITTLCKYVVKSVSGVKTQYGNRIDFVLADQNDEVILSDWNFITRKKLAPTSLVGKTITLEPTNNPKKVRLNVLD